MEKKTFKSYYENPEYKQRHLAYIKVKVECPYCQQHVARCNMTKHKHTKLHQLNEKIYTLKNTVLSF